MASSSYSWENRGPSFDQEPVDRPEGIGWEDSDDDAPSSDAVGHEAADLLIQFLLTLHYAGNLSARSLSVICWYAAKAGAVGKVDAFGFRPEAPSGHFQRHLDAVTGIDMKGQMSWRYTVDVPLHEKYDEAKSGHQLMVTVPHEALNDEIIEDPSILESAAETQWPPLYYANPIVRATASIVIPLALYLDGVPSTNRDGILGIFMYNLISYKRHLVAVVRKSSLCKCGCHGWCTLRPIWCFVHWSVQAMGRGTFPTGRHDHAPWKPADAERADLQGSLLSFIGMLLQVKGDWLEFVSSLGLTSWRDLECPCMFFKAKKTELNKFRGFSPLSDVFPKVSAADYDAACTVCEQKRTLTRDQYMTVKNSLEYNRTKNGPQGRALLVGIPALGLEKHDRLEPDRTLQDVGAGFDSLSAVPAAFPISVTFWRRAVESRARHRLPLFDPELGITLAILCVDILHCLWLGPAKDWCTAVLWSLIDHDVYGVGGPLDNKIPISVLRMKTELWGFYKRWRQAHPGEDVTELENLTPNMLGKTVLGTSPQRLRKSTSCPFAWRCW